VPAFYNEPLNDAVSAVNSASPVDELLSLLLEELAERVVRVAPTTLGDELDGFVARKSATGGLSERGIEWYEQSIKAWWPFRACLVRELRRSRVEDHLARRAASAPVAARNELQVLKACLRIAKSRGQQVDAAILDIPGIRNCPKPRRALSVHQLYELSSKMPKYVRRIVLLAGFVGARQRVWFVMTEDLVDLDAATLTIPPELNKNRRPQRVALTGIEVDLFAEQLHARPSRTRLIFPNQRAGQWNRHRFREQIWLPAVKASGLAGLTFHELRHSCASLMAAAGMDPAVAAQRLGHSDGGALFLRRYRHLYGSEARRQATLFEEMIKSELKPREEPGQ
jgi:integrase